MMIIEVIVVDGAQGMSIVKFIEFRVWKGQISTAGLQWYFETKI